MRKQWRNVCKSQRGSGKPVRFAAAPRIKGPEGQLRSGRRRGLSALQTNDSISAAAQVRVKELSALFDHTRPDGTTCFTALDDAGIRYSTAGENIAAGYSTPEQVVNGWMNSEGHRANILNANFTTIGVGYDSAEKTVGDQRKSDVATNKCRGVNRMWLYINMDNWIKLE